MSRRKAREVAMMALYQIDLNKIDYTDAVSIETILQHTWDENSSPKEKDMTYTKKLVFGVGQNILVIDNLLERSSKTWKLSRMPNIDRNILRLAVFELKWGDDDITVNVAINEAVELAKKYGTDDSARFVNGVLGAVVKA